MQERKGPLSGVRVVEMAGLGPAPFACMMLADMGADVLRITRPGQRPLFGLDQKFNLYDRSRQSLRMDLRDAAQSRRLMSLIDHADILIEGFRPGVMERLGLGPELMHLRNSALVYGRMTGWGQTGPLRERAGHDLTYMAITGALWAIGPEGAPPPPPQNIVADLAGGGMMMVAGALAALLHARQTGEGQVVDAAMSDGAALMMVMQYGLKAAGIGHDGARGQDLLNGGSAWYRCYETKCGGYVALGAIEPQFFRALLEITGRSDDPAFADQYGAADQTRMMAALEEMFRSRTRAQWTELLESVDACAAPVLDMKEAPRHPHNIARGTFQTTDDIVQPGPAPRFSRTPSAEPTHGDTGTADFDSVLKRWADATGDK